MSRTHEPASGRKRSPRREALLAYAGVTLATIAISVAGRWPLLYDYVHVAVALLFLFSAVQLAQRRPGGVARYGLALGGLLTPTADLEPGAVGLVKDLGGALLRAAPSALREAAVATAVAVAVFPPFVAGFYLWHAPNHAFGWAPPPELGSYALSQLLVVGLPEEAFFRGYIQGRLGDAESHRIRFLGASLAPRAWLLQAALFALVHVLVDLNPIRFAVFFPALLFGWLRALRGGIGAAAVLHAMSNLLSDVLTRGWL